LPIIGVDETSSMFSVMVSSLFSKLFGSLIIIEVDRVPPISTSSIYTRYLKILILTKKAKIALVLSVFFF